MYVCYCFRLLERKEGRHWELFFFFFVGVGFCIIDGSFASLASFEEVDEIVGAPQGRGGEGGRWA